MGPTCARARISQFRAAGASQQRASRRCPAGADRLSHAEGRRPWHDGSGARDQPLATRAGHLPSIRLAHIAAARHPAHLLRPLRRGVDARRSRHEGHGDPGPTGLHPPLGAYRRQSRMGGSVDRRPMAFPRRLRAGGSPRPRMVQRSRLARHADEHHGPRPIRRPGRGARQHPRLHADQCHRQLRAGGYRAGDSRRPRRQAGGGSAALLHALQLCRILSHSAENHRQHRGSTPYHRSGRPRGVGRQPGRTPVRHRQIHSRKQTASAPRARQRRKLDGDVRFHPRAAPTGQKQGGGARGAAAGQQPAARPRGFHPKCLYGNVLYPSVSRRLCAQSPPP